MIAPTWSIPSNLIAESVRAMRPYGKNGHEGLALWFGREQLGCVQITHLILPRGAGLTTHPLYLSLSLKAMARITELADRLGCYWAGQIHSHPGRMLGLSELDVEMGVRVQDYLSVVCPYYAQQDTKSFANCGVHMFDRGTYRSFSALEVAQRILLSPEPVTVVDVEV